MIENNDSQRVTNNLNTLLYAKYLHGQIILFFCYSVLLAEG